MRTLGIRDDYKLVIRHSSPASVHGEILQVAKIAAGDHIAQTVGQLSAWSDPGDDDTYRPHWKAHLFLIDNYEYDAQAQVTVTPSLMERHHWTRYGIEVNPQALPPYSPDLPRAVAESLLRSGLCTQPLWVQVHHYQLQSHLEFGELVWEE